MKPIQLVLFTVLAMAVRSFAAEPIESADADSKPLITHLTVAQVKEIAAARVRDTDFPVKASDPWSVVLQIQPKGNVWLAMLRLPKGQITPFQVYVDDATGAAEYITPIVRGEQRFADDADWLIKVVTGLKRVKYPIELETLMRVAYFTGAEFSMGGGTKNGRGFLDYTLRQEKEGPARFDVRCYISEPENTTGPKMVTAAEVAYVDAKLYRYVLVQD